MAKTTNDDYTIYERNSSFTVYPVRNGKALKAIPLGIFKFEYESWAPVKREQAAANAFLFLEALVARANAQE